MVNLYILNPAHKLRFLSKLFLSTSKRAWKDVAPPTSTLPQDDVPPTPPPKANVSHLIKSNMRGAPQADLIRDTEYYKDESEGGFCVFRVEDTLFKVHRCYLQREPSAFGDMFSLPKIQGNNEGSSDEVAIPLYDTVQQFRDLLWVLYAIPSQILCDVGSDSPSVERLLNIAEMTNKYCIASYEAWALERLLTLVRCPIDFLRHAPPTTCARILDIAILCNHQTLLDTVTQRLVARMLWSDMDRRPILQVAESRGIRKLQGVAYYRELTDLERTTHDGRFHTRPHFPTSTLIEKRMRFLAAHHSLTNLWESVRTTPPAIRGGCATHSDCVDVWTELWHEAGMASQTSRHGSADVLGRLKSMMIQLKKSMMGSNAMTLSCALAALESITTTRDDIIAGMMDHFHEF
ncbi:hypothetical protein B0H34DRAFT_706993 [Crassisporium funariophilum]|nr:hypothetical protein B0H34DRAFT_706993 [Crassisporium funariophilum]